jgi:hypothetical protein
MQAKHIPVCSILVVGVLVMCLPALAARAAESCNAAVQAAKADWWSLTHGNRFAPPQLVITSDGRRLTGIQLNYARVVIGRAESACEAAQSAASLAYVGEVQALLHPAAR